MRNCTLLFAVLTFTSAIAVAQIQVDVPGVNVSNPGPNDIAIDTNGNTRSVTCKAGGGVFVRGNGNHVQVGGACTAVHVMGNRNAVRVEKATRLATEGNDNVVTYADPKTRVSNPGNRNKVSAGQ